MFSEVTAEPKCTHVFLCDFIAEAAKQCYVWVNLFHHKKDNRLEVNGFKPHYYIDFIKNIL
jgi:hypothetical protein